jgi:acylphosphatase
MTDAGPSADQRLEATVRGRVQGVGFRVFVVRRAMALGLDGWVANASSGAVDVVAEGPRADLDVLLAALRSGPPAALVQDVSERWGPARGGLVGFAIRSGAHRGD